MKIGIHYNHNSYNCAHYVGEWYEKNLGIKIPVVNEFDRSFAKWLLSNFTEVKQPVYGDLTVMVNQDGSRHVGVYVDNHILHNYQPDNVKHGSVCETPLSLIKRRYKKVSYHRWSK